MARLLALLTAALLSACSAAQGGEAPPSGETGRVRDFAGILTPVEEARLTERLADSQRRYGPEVGIVTVTTLDGKPIEQVSVDYARDWGLGDDKRRDGLMIMVAPSDRRVRLEVGSGIERAYTDAWAQGVVNTMVEHFRQGNWERGMAAGVDMIVAQMKHHPTLPANDNDQTSTSKAA